MTTDLRCSLATASSPTSYLSVLHLRCRRVLRSSVASSCTRGTSTTCLLGVMNDVLAAWSRSQPGGTHSDTTFTHLPATAAHRLVVIVTIIVDAVQCSFTRLHNTIHLPTRSFTLRCLVLTAQCLVCGTAVHAPCPAWRAVLCCDAGDAAELTAIEH